MGYWPFHRHSWLHSLIICTLSYYLTLAGLLQGINSYLLWTEIPLCCISSLLLEFLNPRLHSKSTKCALFLHADIIVPTVVNIAWVPGKLDRWSWSGLLAAFQANPAWCFSHIFCDGFLLCRHINTLKLWHICDFLANIGNVTLSCCCSYRLT